MGDAVLDATSTTENTLSKDFRATPRTAMEATAAEGKLSNGPSEAGQAHWDKPVAGPERELVVLRFDKADNDLFDFRPKSSPVGTAMNPGPKASSAAVPADTLQSKMQMELDFNPTQTSPAYVERVLNQTPASSDDPQSPS